MDFILNEAFEDKFIWFSDETAEEEYSKNESDSFIENDDDKMFLCDEGGEQESSFYRGIDNKNEGVKFFNQDLEANPENFDEDYLKTMNSLNFLIQRIVKKLNLILLKTVKIYQTFLKTAFCGLIILIICFFIQLFMVLCIINLMN